MWTVIPGIVSEKLFSALVKQYSVVLWHAEGLLVNLSQVVETRAMIWRSYVPKKGSNQDIQVF